MKNPTRSVIFAGRLLDMPADLAEKAVERGHAVFAETVSSPLPPVHAERADAVQPAERAVAAKPAPRKGKAAKATK